MVEELVPFMSLAILPHPYHRFDSSISFQTPGYYDSDENVSVYHDLGNLNVSFMTSKARHNRKANLALLCDVVKDAFGVNLEVNSRWE